MESHLTSSTCPVYADIREKYGDLSSDEELVNYFGEVLARREALEEEEEQRGGEGGGVKESEEEALAGGSPAGICCPGAPETASLGAFCTAD